MRPLALKSFSFPLSFRKIPVMNDAMLEALKASIAKWEDNAKVSHILDAKVLGDTCALCIEAERQKNLDGVYENNCTYCPIQDATGESECADTPWSRAYNAYVLCRDKCTPLSDFHAAAALEVSFLSSLLPKEPS